MNRTFKITAFIRFIFIFINNVKVFNDTFNLMTLYFKFNVSLLNKSINLIQKTVVQKDV